MEKQLLLSRTSVNVDESLESYVLRLAIDNGYRDPDKFLRAVSNHILQELKSDLEIRFKNLNLIHAKGSSKKRLQLLRGISHLAFKDAHTIQSLLLYRGREKFCGSYGSVFYHGITYPRIFLRQNVIPVCPRCLERKGYIRQLWHFSLYDVCHEHKVKLVHQCRCGHSICFLDDHEIWSCPKCGTIYSDLHTDASATCGESSFSRWLAGGNVPLLPSFKTGHRWGLVLWWMLLQEQKPETFCRSKIKPFVQFFKQWPESFEQWLKDRVDKALKYSIKPSDQLNFKDVFGELLFVSTQLPSSKLSENSVLSYLMSFFEQHFAVDDGFIAQLRLSAIEVAILLNCDMQQIAVLVDHGELPTLRNDRASLPLTPYLPNFHLGDVFCLWMTQFQSEHANLHILTSRW